VLHSQRARALPSPYFRRSVYVIKDCFVLYVNLRALSGLRSAIFPLVSMSIPFPFPFRFAQYPPILCISHGHLGPSRTNLSQVFICGRSILSSLLVTTCFLELLLGLTRKVPFITLHRLVLVFRSFFETFFSQIVMPSSPISENRFHSFLQFEQLCKIPYCIQLAFPSLIFYQITLPC